MPSGSPCRPVPTAPSPTSSPLISASSFRRFSSHSQLLSLAFNPAIFCVCLRAHHVPPKLHRGAGHMRVSTRSLPHPLVRWNAIGQWSDLEAVYHAEARRLVNDQCDLVRQRGILAEAWGMIKYSVARHSIRFQILFNIISIECMLLK